MQRERQRRAAGRGGAGGCRKCGAGPASEALPVSLFRCGGGAGLAAESGDPGKLESMEAEAGWRGKGGAGLAAESGPVSL